MKTAYLTNDGEYTIFSYGDRAITFLTGKRLRRYISVKEWDNGYIVVECENKDSSLQEDYIDLIPVLKNLYFDTDRFLKNIEEVKLKYE
ncbi:MAG: hypothetical protein K5985_07120 [Lachnospiraceae bacterium]|nr:hypothetical protein [Lachnospiraceae bacterium]